MQGKTGARNNIYEDQNDTSGVKKRGTDPT